MPTVDLRQPRAMFVVYFEDSVVGYQFAASEWNAIQAVVGDYAHDTTGARDYRYTARSSTPLEA
jgi:hypothetical protein